MTVRTLLKLLIGLLLVLSCAGSRPAVDGRLARRCAEISCLDTFAAAKAHALELCATPPDSPRRFTGAFSVRSCRGRDQIITGGLGSMMLSFEHPSGRLASICRF